MARVAATPRRSASGGIKAEGHELLDDLDRHDRREAEDIADRQVDAPRDDDEELGGGEEEDQDAVEEEDLQGVEVGEALGLRKQKKTVSRTRKMRTQRPPRKEAKDLPRPRR